MDKLREKINALKLEADSAHEKHEQSEVQVKKLQDEILQKDQEIASLTHKNSVLESEVAALEGRLDEAKVQADQGAQHGSHNESLTKKISLIETELEESDRNLRETTEKLRQTDVKAEHFEKKVTSVEKERDEWEVKYEKLAEQYAAAKAELEDIQSQLENI